MPDTPNALRLPGSALTANPAAFDAWYRKLPSGEQRQLLLVIGSALKHLSGAQRQALVRVVGAEEAQAARSGLGSAWASIGTIASGLAQVGVQLYGQEQQKDLQADLAKRQAQTQTAIAQMQLEAEAEIQKIMAQAQIEAAKQAAGAHVTAAGYSVAQTQIRWQQAMPLALTAGGIAVVGGLGYLIVKRKRGRR